MAAATAERNTPRRLPDDLSFGVGAAKKIFAGTIVVLANTGYAEAGTTATAKKSVGIAQATVDNSSGSAGDVNVPVRRGCYLLANSAAGDAIANADYGSSCYVVDDQTVAKTDGGSTRSVAGIVRGVDSAGVWVEF